MQLFLPLPAAPSPLPYISNTKQKTTMICFFIIRKIHCIYHCFCYFEPVILLFGILLYVLLFQFTSLSLLFLLRCMICMGKQLLFYSYQHAFICTLDSHGYLQVQLRALLVLPCCYLFFVAFVFFWLRDRTRRTYYYFYTSYILFFFSPMNHIDGTAALRGLLICNYYACIVHYI